MTNYYFCSEHGSMCSEICQKCKKEDYAMFTDIKSYLHKPLTLGAVSKNDPFIIAERVTSNHEKPEYRAIESQPDIFSAQKAREIIEIHDSKIAGQRVDVRIFRTDLTLWIE